MGISGKIYIVENCFSNKESFIRYLIKKHNGCM